MEPASKTNYGIHLRCVSIKETGYQIDAIAQYGYTSL